MALRLTPSGYQKVLAAQVAKKPTTQTMQPMVGGWRASEPQPQPRPMPQTQQPSSRAPSVSPELRFIKSGLGLSGQIAKLLDSGKGVQAGLGGLQSAAQIAQGAQQLAQGQTVPGALSVTGGLVSGAGNTALAPAIGSALGIPGQAVSGLAGGVGGALGLAGLGYSLSQGQADGSMVGAGLSAGGQVLSGVGSAASTGALGTGAQAASGTLGALGAGLSTVGAGAAATWAAGQSVHSLASALDSGDDRQLGAGVGAVTGMVAGAAIGTLIAPGVGTLIGLALGAAAGGSLGGLFGQNTPHYFAIREHAMDVAKGELGEYRNALAAAIDSGDTSKLQTALSQAQGDGRIRVSFDLPQDVAAAIGVPAKFHTAELENLSPDQFMKFLKAWDERKGFTNNWLIGSGDIPYLNAEMAGKVAGQAYNTATKTLDIVTQALKPALDAMPPVAPLSWEDVGDYRLSPELEYSQYHHLGVETPYHQRGIDYQTIKQQAAAGQLDLGTTIRGQRLAQELEPGKFVSADQFASAAGKTNLTQLRQRLAEQEAARAADERAMEDAIWRVQNRQEGEGVSPELMKLYLRAIAGRLGYGGSYGLGGPADVSSDAGPGEGPGGI